MIASLKGYGRIARTLLAVLGALLVLGIIGSLLMGVHARHSAREHRSSTRPRPSPTARSRSRSRPRISPARRPPSARASSPTQIQAIVIDPSDFDDVTLYSPEGTILYSTATSRIGNAAPGREGADQGGPPRGSADERVRRHALGDAPACGSAPASAAPPSSSSPTPMRRSRALPGPGGPTRYSCSRCWCCSASRSSALLGCSRWSATPPTVAWSRGPS